MTYFPLDHWMIIIILFLSVCSICLRQIQDSLVFLFELPTGCLLAWVPNCHWWHGSKTVSVQSGCADGHVDQIKTHLSENPTICGMSGQEQKNIRWLLRWKGKEGKSSPQQRFTAKGDLGRPDWWDRHRIAICYKLIVTWLRSFQTKRYSDWPTQGYFCLVIC